MEVIKMSGLIRVVDKIEDLDKAELNYDNVDILICTYKMDATTKERLEGSMTVYDEVTKKQIEEVFQLIDFTLRKDVVSGEF
jgi:hypothetical protein